MGGLYSQLHVQVHAIHTCTTFTQCPDSGVEPPGGGSDLVVFFFGGGGSLTLVYTVIPLKEQTPACGAERTSSSKKFLLKVPYIAGADPAFCLHTQKAVGSNPTNLEEHKRRVRPRNWGRWFAFTLRGKRRVWPRTWVRPRNRSTV